MNSFFQALAVCGMIALLGAGVTGKDSTTWYTLGGFMFICNLFGDFIRPAFYDIKYALFYDTHYDYFGKITTILALILLILLSFWPAAGIKRLLLNSHNQPGGATTNDEGPGADYADGDTESGQPPHEAIHAAGDDNAGDEPQHLEPGEPDDGNVPLDEEPHADNAAGDLPPPQALIFPPLPRPRSTVVDDTLHLAQNAGPLERARRRKLRQLENKIGDVPRHSRTSRTTYDEIVYLERLAESHRNPNKGDWVHLRAGGTTATSDYVAEMSQINPEESAQSKAAVASTEEAERTSPAAIDGDEASTAADSTSTPTDAPGDEEVELLQNAPPKSPAAMNGDEAVTAADACIEPTCPPGDAESEPLPAAQAKSWPYGADLQARALLTQSDDDEIVADDRCTPAFLDDYLEMELPSSAGTWAELVKKMEGLTLGSALRPAVESDAAAPPSVFDLSAVLPLEIESPRPDTPEEPTESGVVLPPDADMSDAIAPIPEPFDSDNYAGEPAEPTGGLLPPPKWLYAPARPASDCLLEPDMDDAPAVPSGSFDFSLCDGDSFLVTGGPNQMDMSYDTSARPEVSVLPGADMGDAPAAAGNFWDLSSFAGDLYGATTGLGPVDTLMGGPVASGQPILQSTVMGDPSTRDAESIESDDFEWKPAPHLDVFTCCRCLGDFFSSYMMDTLCLDCWAQGPYQPAAPPVPPVQPNLPDANMDDASTPAAVVPGGDMTNGESDDESALSSVASFDDPRETKRTPGEDKPDAEAEGEPLFAPDPMYPDHENFPLHGIGRIQANMLISNWILSSTKCLGKLKPYSSDLWDVLLEQDIWEDLKAIRHRIAQINDYGTDEIGNWDLSKIDVSMIARMRTDWGTIEEKSKDIIEQFSNEGTNVRLRAVFEDLLEVIDDFKELVHGY